MGCDIHCFVETWDKRKKKWKKVTGFINDYYDPSDSYFSSKEFKNSDNILMNRNYWEFAILANVKNGSDFEGPDISNRIEPISYPKGIPDDISEEVKKEIDEFGSEGHSHSYLTAKEIMEYDKSNFITDKGFISCKQYKEFLNGILPTTWREYIGGVKIKVVSNDECVKFQEEHPEINVYTQVEWKEPITKVVPFLFDKCLKQLMSRSKNGTGNDVRIVFWFDS